MFHDKITNETPYDCYQRKYEINVYYVTMDTIIGSVEKRLSKHKEIYLNFEWLHQTNFKFISNLPESTMNKLAEILTFYQYGQKNITRTIIRFC